MARIEVIQGDITKLYVQAIVNAANTTLLGGGGVDGAIHRAAGPNLLEECKFIGGCPTGEARLTKGYQLPAPFVIHTVGPIWNGGKSNEAEKLARCYRNSLALAEKHNIASLAFPCISTGAYRFPFEAAAKIAIAEVQKFLKNHQIPEQVVFCCFGRLDAEVYQGLLAAK